MKRFIPLLLLVAIVAGIFSPVTASFSTQGNAPIHAQVAQAQTATVGTPPDNANPADYNGSCGVAFGDFANCLEWVFYYIPFQTGTWLMTISAELFDSFAAITLSSKMYTASQFINDGWRLTRDFANIFFILILLYIAISLILGLDVGHANPKKMLASLIFVALLINFSLLITEVVIDASNSLALVFYNQITVTATSATGTPLPPNAANVTQDAQTEKDLGVTPKPLSESLVAAFQPQILSSASFYNNLLVDNPRTFSFTSAASGAAGGAVVGSFIPGIGTLLGGAIGLTGSAIHAWFGAGKSVPPEIMMGLYIVIGAMYLVVAYSFFVAALSFVGRLIGLWVAIIFAPVAFISYIIPATRSLPGFGWTEWWKNLFATAFAAPVYFLFLLLISIMTKSGIVANINNLKGVNSLTILMVVLISFLILITMLLKATKYVKKASGDIGEMVFKGAAALGGVGLMAASGGLSVIGSRTVGAWAKAKDTDLNRDLASGNVTSQTKAHLLSQFKDKKTGLFKDERGKKLSEMSNEDLAKSAEFQRMQRNAKTKLKTSYFFSSASFDPRQNAVASALSKATGMSMEGFGAFGTDRTAGGYDAKQGRKQKKQQEFAAKLGVNHAQQNEIEDTLADRKREIAAAQGEANQFRAMINAGKGDVEVNVVIDGKLEKKSAKEALEIKTTEVTKLSAGNVQEGNIVTKHDVESGVTSTGGYKYKDTDVGKTKDRWTLADVAAKKKKADGTLVDASDVASGGIKTESMSLQQLERLQDGGKNARTNAYFHQQMLQSGYDVHGEKYNDLGQVARLGHMDFKSANKVALENWRKDMFKGLQKGFANGGITAVAAGVTAAVVTGLGAPAVALGLGAALVGSIAAPMDSFLGGFKEAIRGMKEGISVRRGVEKVGGEKGKQLYNRLDPGMFGNRRMNARAIYEASDTAHKVHEYQSKYKAEAGGFLGLLKSIVSSSNSSHGGGGGHAADSGGGGGHGGGGHH